MTWIRTIPFADAGDELRRVIEQQRTMYPREYEVPAFPGLEPGGAPAFAEAARDDRHARLGAEPMSLLNHLARGVSA
jgi:hypothetical protein